jgi:4-fold beta-flower domain-containing protein
MATGSRATMPLFRWDGPYWGFVADGLVYDRYGRHVGWLRATEAYHLSGRFMGELCHGAHVLRDTLRAEPIHLAPQPAVPYATPPAPPPDREACEPLDGWTDALPWPLPPPHPPRA